MTKRDDILLLLLLLAVIMPVKGLCHNACADGTDTVRTSVDSLLYKLSASGSDEEGERNPLDNFLPPSPQASGLARYGKYPVSHSTGLPDITIPIYEIKLGNLEIPISISYHASGIKADEISSTVGLGWTLNAGGAIVREVCGGPDLENLDETYYDYYKTSTLIKDEVPKDSKTEILNDLLYSNGDGSTSHKHDYDCLSDRYSYNFAGHTGKFRYSYRNHEFYPIDGYSKMLISGTPSTDRTSNNSKFYIVDTDGNQFFFNRQECTGEQSDENTANVTAWYLTEIITAKGKVKINYTNSKEFKVGIYQERMRTGLFAHYKYSREQINEMVHSDAERHALLAASLVECNETRQETMSSEYAYKTPVVSSISFNGGTIYFTYKDDRKDVWKTRLDQITVRNNQGDTIKTVNFHNNSFWGKDSSNYRMMLNALSVSDQGRFTFSYNESHDLPSYTIPVNGKNKQLVLCQTDYWGYYNGSRTRHWIPKEAKEWIVANCKCSLYNLDIINLADRHPNLEYTKCGSLISITYPTGGKTTFEYGANDYETGGLRIENIANYDSNNTLLENTSFSYNHSYLLFEDPIATMHYTTTYRNKFEGDDIFFKHNLKATMILGRPTFPLSYGTPVFYTDVTETSGNGDKIDYHYDCYPAPETLSGHASTAEWPQLSYPMLNDYGDANPVLTKKKYIDSNGKLLKTEIYDYEAKNVRDFCAGVKIYNFFELASQHINDFYSAVIPSYLDVDCLKFDSVNVHSFIYQLKSKTVTYNQLGYTVTQNYTYDKNFNTNSPKTITVTNSDGKEYVTSYQYAFESEDSLTKSMAYNYYYYDQPVMVRKNCNNTLLSTVKTSFKFLPTNDYFYPDRTYESRLNGAMFEKYYFADYDSVGNILSLIINKTDTARLEWGYGSICPKAYYQNGRLMYSYTWKPLCGVTSIIGQNGYKTTYSYDNACRLSAISDADGIKQQFSYCCKIGPAGIRNIDNHVLSESFFSPTGDKKSVSIQFYDDLGRAVLKAENDIGGNGNYLYSYQTYDAKGRRSRLWLPVVGSYSVNYSEIKNIPAMSYDTYNDYAAFRETTYDALDRPVFTQSPGDAWHESDKGVVKENVTNDTLDVKLYKAPMDGKNHLVESGYYRPHMLLGEKTTDEDGHSLTVFTDKLGRKILERRASDTGNNDTYLVYNDLGQLRFVLSPEYQNHGYKAIFGYEYRYDDRGNVVKKFLPGCGYTQYWYDRGNRLIAMQDAMLREKGKYRFYIYDNLSRVAVQGICSSLNRGESVTHASFKPLQAGLLGTGYAIDCDLKIEDAELEAANYYDDYSFSSAALVRSLTASTSFPTMEEQKKASNGLPTGSITRTSNGQLLVRVNFYDTKGRVVETWRTTADGGVDDVQTEYTYTGNIAKMTQSLIKNGSAVASTVTENSYNTHNDRLASSKVTVNEPCSASSSTISFDYDDLGRLKTVRRPGKAGNVSYDYNVHGLTTGITSPTFTEKLYYEDGQNGYSTPCYSGNISSQRWTNGDYANPRWYRFTYDKLNRLTNAEYTERDDHGQAASNFDEKILEYDFNGNIDRLQRHGKKQNGIYGKIDNLHIYHNGNQLDYVVDDADKLFYTGAFDFNGDASNEAHYKYNGSGSLTEDTGRGIALIEYDDWNNPRRIQFNNGNVTEYIYSATGKKLRTVHYTAAPNITVATGQTHELSASEILSKDSTEYIGGLIMRNSVPTMYLFPGGYFSFPMKTSSSTNRCIPGFDVSKGTFHYYNSDHLGNIREVVAENGTLEQVNNYYPFGAPFSDNDVSMKDPGLQPYKYSGKELDLTHGLNTYDHGARQNYSILGIWDRVDPLAEKYYNISPYAVCKNSPINIIDLKGLEGVKYFDNDSNKHIDVNVVVLLQPQKQIPENASRLKIKHLIKKNAKIARKNNGIIEKIKYSLNSRFNGENVKNSLGEKIIFGFNVIGVETENYKTTSAVSIRNIAIENGLKAKTPDRYIGSFGYGLALPIVISQGSAGSSLGITVNPLVRVNFSNTSFEDILGHEAAHTFGLEDNYLGSGIMAFPPQEPSTSDIDEIWNNAYEE